MAVRSKVATFDIGTPLAGQRLTAQEGEGTYHGYVLAASSAAVVRLWDGTTLLDTVAIASGTVARAYYGAGMRVDTGVTLEVVSGTVIGTVRCSDPRGLLGQAVLYLDAGEYAGSGAVVDRSANRLHAKLGSAATADIVPVATGDNALVLPGTAGNEATIPHQASHTPTGLFEIVAHLRSVSWAAAGIQSVAAKRSGVAGSWMFRKATAYAGIELILWFGGSPATYSSDALPVTVADDAEIWIRALRNPTTGDVNFYWAPNSPTRPTSWIALGATRPGTAGPIDTLNYPLEFGMYAGSVQMFLGHIKQVTISDGADTVVDVPFDQAEVGATSFVAPTGQTVTIARSGADTNDPLFLPHEAGENYVYIHGSASNVVHTPSVSNAGVSVTTVVANITFDADGTAELFVADEGINRFRCQVGALNTVTFTSTSSTDGTSAQTTAGIPLGASRTLFNWWRVDVNWAAATIRLRASQQAADIPESEVVWSLDQTASWGAVPTVVGAATLYVGGFGLASTSATSRLRSFRFERDGVVDFDLHAADIVAPYASVVDRQGKTWTLRRATSGRKLAVVDRPLFLFGTDDYLEIPHHPLLDIGTGQDFTVVVAFRSHATQTAFERLIQKGGAAATPTWSIVFHTSGHPYMAANDGATAAVAVAGTGWVAGQHTVVAGRRTGTKLDTMFGGTQAATSTDVSTGNFTNSSAVRVGSRFSPSDSFVAMEFTDVVMFRRALSNTELARLAEELAA